MVQCLGLHVSTAQRAEIAWKGRQKGELFYNGEFLFEMENEWRWMRIVDYTTKGAYLMPLNCTYKWLKRETSCYVYLPQYKQPQVGQLRPVGESALLSREQGQGGGHPVETPAWPTLPVLPGVLITTGT